MSAFLADMRKHYATTLPLTLLVLTGIAILSVVALVALPRVDARTTLAVVAGIASVMTFLMAPRPAVTVPHLPRSVGPLVGASRRSPAELAAGLVRRSSVFSEYAMLMSDVFRAIAEVTGGGDIRRRDASTKPTAPTAVRTVPYVPVEGNDYITEVDTILADVMKEHAAHEAAIHEDMVLATQRLDEASKMMLRTHKDMSGAWRLFLLVAHEMHVSSPDIEIVMADPRPLKDLMEQIHAIRDAAAHSHEPPAVTTEKVKRVLERIERGT